MGQILIESTPRQQGQAAVFDPANEPTVGAKTFSQLRWVGTPQSGVVGGRFALPAEFDQNIWASRFEQEGQPVLAAQSDQPVLGTGWVAEGWTVWKYPDKGQPVIDPETQQQKTELRDNPNWTKKSGADVPEKIAVPLFQIHPNAGKPHTVPSMEVNGPTYVLLCRPLEVQKQVNEIYGLASIDQMTAEVYGETIAGGARGGGMLGEQELQSARNLDQDLNADRVAEENLGRSTVVHSSLPSNIPKRLTKPPQRVSR